ncbi:MAG: phage tail tape measure protein [Deltaproteobacteria bacterium]|nr:phage tail tape measure protein [Deltaproteobacteria bacterium]
MADKTLTLGTVFTSDISQVISAIKRLRTEMQGLNTRMQGLSTKATSASKATKSMSTSMTKATKDTKKLGETQQWTGKQISKVSGAWERMKAAMKVTASYGLASKAIFGIYTALTAGTQEIINFDQALKNLQAISGATEAQVSVMGDTIKQVAKNTKFSTVEVAEGMVLLTQAGFSASESMAAIQAVANLATGTLTSLKVTSDLLTTTIRAFSLEATEASRVADVMANAINKSKLTIDKLRISFNFVGSVAAQTGLSLEQTAASMMVLANSGLRASTIGTGLRQVLARLMAPTGKLREAFESHNIELAKVNPRIVGFQTAIKNLLPVMWDSKKGAVDMTKAFELFGLRGSQAAAILVKSFAGTEYANMLSKVYDVGAAEAMAGIQAEGLGVKLKNLADRFKLVAIAAGEAGVSSAIGLLVDTLKGLSYVMEAVAKNVIGTTLIGWGAWSLTILGVVKSLQLLIGLLKSAAAWAGLQAMVSTTSHHFQLLSMWLTTTGAKLPKLRAALSAFWAMLANLSPLTKFVLGLGAVATAFGIIVNWSKKHREELEKTVEVHKAGIGSLQQHSKALEDLNEKLEDGEDVTEQYKATVKRLQKEHEDLARYVNFNTGSYEELNRAIQDLSFDKFKNSLPDLISLIALQTKRVKELTAGFDALKVSTDAAADVWINNEFAGKASVEQWKTGRIAINSLENANQDLTSQLVLFVKQEKITIDEAKELITKYFETEGATDKLADAIKRLEDAMAALNKETSMVSGGALRSITDEYEAYYKTLNDLEKARMVVATDTMLKTQKNRASTLKKRLRDEPDAERLIGVAKGDEAAKTLLKQIDNNKKEELSFQALINFKKNALREYAGDVDSRYSEDLKKIDEYYEEEIDKVKAKALTKVSVEKLSQIDRDNISKQAIAKETELRKKRDSKFQEMAMRHAGFMAAIEGSVSKVKEKKQKGKSAAELKLESDKQYYTAMERASGDAFEKLRMQQDKQLLADQKWLAKRLTNHEAFNESIADVMKKYGNLRTAHENEAAAKSLKIVKDQADQAAKIEEDKAKTILEAKKKIAVGDKDETARLAQEERDLELGFMEDRLNRHRTHYENLKILHGEYHSDVKAVYQKLIEEENKVEEKRTSNAESNHQDRINALKRYFNEGLSATQLYSDKWLEIMKFMHQEHMIETHDFLNRMKSYYVYWMDEHEKQWKRGEIAVEDYVASIQEAFDHAAITLEEYKDRMAATSGSIGDALKYGFERAKEKLQSMQEMFIEIGENFVDVFATNMTGALEDWIDGTKSAGEAFEDFAQDTIRWISEIMTKWLIMQALTGLMGMGMSAGGGLGAPTETGLLGGKTAYKFHTGGIVGVTPQPMQIVNPNIFANAKHYETGGIIGAKEEPVIAHKGEGVFTPEQMKALGGGTHIETHVNVDDARLATRLQSGIEEKVKEILREEMR